MLANGNNVVFNSSEESDEILSPGFLPESSLVPSQSHHRHQSCLAQSPEWSLVTSQSHHRQSCLAQSPDEMELGIHLGRRLARLELGNEAAKEQLDKIKQKTRASEEALENSKIDDLEEKVISMEAQLLSEEKQGFDANERIIKVEENLRKKNEEISALKKMIVKHQDQEERFAKLERDNCEMTNQFVKLLDTCETFRDELESLKKMNSELIKNLKKHNTTSKDSLSDVKQIASVPSSHPHLLNNLGTHNYAERVIEDFSNTTANDCSPTPTSEDQRRKIKIDCDSSKKPHTSVCVQGDFNPSTGDEVPARGPIYYPQTSQAAEPFYYPQGAQNEVSAAEPIYYPQTSEAAESFYYPEGVHTDPMYFSGSTSQSDGWEMMQNPDSGVYYYQGY